MRRLPLAMAAVILLGGCAVAPVEVIWRRDGLRIERTDFGGWPDSYRMTNGEVEVVVVPQVARIMGYGPADGPNMLWVNPEAMPRALADGEAPPRIGGWTNFGGYKLWPAPQRAWNWPPDPDLDAGPCRALVRLDGALVLIGQASREAGIRFDRVIRLAPEGSRLEIEQIMVNTGPAPVRWAIWDVTQVPADAVAFVPLGEGAAYRVEAREEPAGVWREINGMLLARRGDVSSKAFVSGPPAWLGCRRGGWVFLKAFEMAPGLPPPPETAREVWVGTGDYLELEVVGPAVTLEPGATARLVETWHLCPVASGEPDDEAVARSAGECAAAALAAP